MWALPNHPNLHYVSIERTMVTCGSPITSEPKWTFRTRTLSPGRGNVEEKRLHRTKENRPGLGGLTKIRRKWCIR